jgi:iron-sulfur cluster assembly accessory protein
MTIETYTPESCAKDEVIKLTPAAIKHFETRLATASDHFLRLSAKTSGCSGYSYVLDMVQQPADNDLVIKVTENLSVAVDYNILPLVRNTEIDYVREGVNGIVKFNNPNVTNECGCGESFNVN